MTKKSAEKYRNFFLLVSLLAIPFLILAFFVDLTKYIPIKLPISALMFLCPITAAIILTKREDKENGIKELLKCIWDYKKIKNHFWLIPTFLLIPLLMYFAYLIMKWFNYPLPNPNLQFIDAIIFSIIFFIG